MAKQTSTQITAADLEFVIEYLILLSQSKRALQLDIPLYKSSNRIRLFDVAIRIEKAMLEKREQDFIDEINRVCVDVEGIVTSTVPKSEIQRLKSAIRQKRYKNNDFKRVFFEYKSTIDFITNRNK